MLPALRIQNGCSWLETSLGKLLQAASNGPCTSLADTLLGGGDELLTRLSGSGQLVLPLKARETTRSEF